MLGATRPEDPTREQVLEALKDVQDPELHRSLVELDMITGVEIAGSRVTVNALLTISGCPLRETIVASIGDRVRALPGVTDVRVNLGVMEPGQRQALVQRLRAGEGGRSPFLGPNSHVRVIAIASGKGGVGKSTVTVNLAAAMAGRGARVGIVDADVYGFSVPRMLGVSGRPTMVDDMMIPLERDGVRVISMGFLVAEDDAVIWRGPMLHKALTTFLSEVHWGDLDYLLIDLPPGTGDVALSIAQTLPAAAMIIVTTPQPAASNVAVRSAKMAEKVNMEVLGVVENMAYYETPDGGRDYIFGRGGGRDLAALLEVPLLGEIPVERRIREAGDAGEPVVWSQPDSAAARAFRSIAEQLMAVETVKT